MSRAPYMIIGNSAAAVAAIAGLRSRDAETPVTLIAREPHHTYSRPLISYLLGGRVTEEQMPYRPPDFYERNHVEPMLGVEVMRVDPEARTVRTGNGRTLGFDKLLIATGGTPIVPPDVKGADADGVFTFTTWDDARRIRAYIERHGVADAVVVGAGLIGLKSVEALAELGIRVRVVELADRVLSATFDHTASDLARKRMEEAGVELHTGTTVTEVQSHGGAIGAVLRGGALLTAQMVVFAIGVRPNVALVAGTAIEVDRGIVVDDHMRTSVAGIYAAGDVAQGLDLIGGVRRPIPIFPNAYRQGLVAGCNMAGGDRALQGGMAMNAVDVFGLPTISVGLTSPEGEGYETLSRLDAAAPSYRKIVLRDNRIVGAIFIGEIARAGIITNLIREKVDVSGFKHLLLSGEFGLISLPKDYRKHVVSGQGIEV